MENIDAIINGSYGMGYLKECLNYNKNHSILDDMRIKEFIIANKNRHELTWFCEDERIPDKLIVRLLSNGGTEILMKSEYFEDRINAIFASNRECINELLKDDKFLECVGKSIKGINYFDIVNSDSAVVLINYLINNNINYKIVLNNLTKEAQKDVFIKCDIDHKKDLVKLKSKTINELMNEGYITSLSELNNDNLYAVLSKNINLPFNILNNQDFINKITNQKTSIEYRALINQLEKSNDVDKIEEIRRNKTDKIIASYNKETNMLENLNYLYNQLICSDKDNQEKILSNIFSKESQDNINQENSKFYFSLLNALKEDGLDKVKEKMQEYSSITLTNLIIDYHFKEYTRNVFIDIDELNNFQNTIGETLNDEDKQMYLNIRNLDSLDFDKKVELHNKLKEINTKEKYYDDLRNAKNKSYELINEQVLNSSNISGFYNEEKSNEFGVPIYTLEGQPFKIIVKAYNEEKDEVLYNNPEFNQDGASFSIDGSEKLDTFKDPKSNYNLAFEKLPIDQVVHTFPVDSFTNYRQGEKATNRVNKLYTPDELVNTSNNYNEVLVAVPNLYSSKESVISLEEPKPFAIYCYDSLNYNDVESAKNLNIGIIIVDTKKYSINRKNKISMYDTLSIENNNYNYLDEVSQDNNYGRLK